MNDCMRPHVDSSIQGSSWRTGPRGLRRSPPEALVAAAAAGPPEAASHSPAAAAAAPATSLVPFPRDAAKVVGIPVSECQQTISLPQRN